MIKVLSCYCNTSSTSVARDMAKYGPFLLDYTVLLKNIVITANADTITPAKQ